MRFRFPLAAFLAALIALPAVAQQRSTLLDGTEALTQGTRDASRPAARGFDVGDPFTGVLLGTKEVPANTSAARAYAYGQFDATTNELYVYVPVTGLQGAFQAAHIHSGAAGTNGPVLYPATDVFGDGSDVEIDFFVTLTDPQVALLQAGNLYVNVHSSAFPNGEIRTQLVASDFLDALRARPVGSVVSTLAYVARTQGAFTYLNDGEGGLAIRQTSGAFFDAVQSGAVQVGSVVRVTGTTSDFRGLLQINEANLAQFEVAQVLPGNINSFAEVVTLAEIASDGEALESVLVAVTDVTLAGGAGGTFTPGTNYAADDGSGPATPVVVRVPNAADTEIPGQPVPTGLTVVLGVVGQFTMAMPAVDGYQILVIEDYDVNPTGRVQVIHNSADPALSAVQVSASTSASDPATVIPFRSTAMLDVPAFVGVEIVASDLTRTVSASTFTFVVPGDAPGTVVLQGVSDPAAFAPNPDGLDTGLVLFSFGTLPSGSSIPNGQVLAIGVHGTTDAPAIDVRTPVAPVIDGAFYGDAIGFLAPPSPVTLSVFPQGQNTPVGTFNVDLSGLSGQSALLFASGFLSPAANRDGPAFALLLVRADGTTTTFPNTIITAGEASPATEALRVTAVANPVHAQTAVRYTLTAAGPARVSVLDVLGREVAVLAQGDAAAGEHEATLSASSLAPGVYTLRLTSAGQVATSRVTVVR